jgi:hypothetical protein
MSKVIDTYISQNNTIGVMEECLLTNQPYLGILVSKICIENSKTTMDDKFYELYKQLLKRIELSSTGIKPTRVMLYCNWLDSKDLCSIWNKMSKGDYCWNNVQIVWEEPADYYVVINCPPINVFPDPSKTLVFQMEPNMESNPQMWGSWANPSKKDFLWVGCHRENYNNNEWHLSKTYNQLMKEEVTKNTKVANILSTVLSDKYRDPGHIKRVDFVKFLETKGFPVHVYGGNKFEWKDYKGSLPYHNKDNAILPYKYTFNAENTEIRGYYTEKLIDGILGECLVFYWGCTDIRNFLDNRAYVQLGLFDFERDYQIIKTAIEEDWHSQRLPYIREAKQKILNETQFFPRLENILENIKKEPNKVV